MQTLPYVLDFCGRELGRSSRFLLSSLLIACFNCNAIVQATTIEVAKKTSIESSNVLILPDRNLEALDRAYAKIAARNFGDAEVILSEARQADPVNHWIAANLGLIYMVTGRPALANREYLRISRGSIPYVQFFSDLRIRGVSDWVGENFAERPYLEKLQEAWSASENKLIDGLPSAAINLSRKSEADAKEVNAAPSAIQSEPFCLSIGYSPQSAIDHIKGWARAWGARDLARYIASYAPDFKGKYRSNNQWKSNRMRILRRERFIDIKLSRMEAVREPLCSIVVTFIQEYRSSRSSDVGMKTLHLTWRSDRWMIVQEQFYSF